MRWRSTYASCQTSICSETAAAASEAGAGADIARVARRDAEIRLKNCILDIVVDSK